MISASKARDKANRVIKEKYPSELQKISKMIDEATKRGYFSISRSGYLEPQLMKELEELGYKVYINVQDDKPSYTISWK